jgi:hypothetical protein
MLGGEGSHLRRSDFNSWPGIGKAQLYAVYRNIQNTQTDEFFPAGEFGVAFLQEDGVNVVVFQVTEDGVARIDYQPLTNFEEILNNNDVLFTPEPSSN